jgi:hypothetical protein
MTLYSTRIASWYPCTLSILSVHPVCASLSPPLQLGIDLGLLLDPDDLVLFDGVLSVTELEFLAPETDGDGGNGEDQPKQHREP